MISAGQIILLLAGFAGAVAGMVVRRRRWPFFLAAAVCLVAAALAGPHP